MPSEAPAPVLRSIAVAGNAVALFGLVLLLLNGNALFSQKAPGPGAITPPQAVAPAPRLLFVLLDGLREDVTREAALMPELQRLAANGSRSVAQVEALVPSTVAGLRAEVEGIVLPPAASLYDFASPAAAHGGFLESNHRLGRRCFAAVPRLWVDLYGAWIDEAVTTTEIDGEDQHLLEETLRHLRDPQWDLLVVHFSRPDVAAHLSGGDSPRYRAAATWCDGALAQLAGAAGPETTLIITADHGVTRSGGHASADREVLRIPVLATGDRAPRLPPEMRQVEIASWMESMVSSGALPQQREEHRTATSWPGWVWAAGVGSIAFVALLLQLTSAAELNATPRAAFWLHAGLWIVAMAGIFFPAAAAMLGCWWLVFCRSRQGRLLLAGPALAAGAGLLSGSWRMAQSRATDVAGRHPSALPTGVECGLALALAAGVLFVLYRRRSADLPLPASWACTWGAAAVLAASAGTQWQAATLSLSALDVRSALSVTHTWLGLPGGLVVAALGPVAPLFCLLLPTVPALARGHPRLLPAVAAGAGAVLAGEAFTGAILLRATGGQGPLATASFALALCLRSAATLALLFPALAGLAWLALPKRSR